jgi:hypothetical protein
MTRIILEENGRQIDVSGPDALAKALGWGAGIRKPIVMTDESGQLIGAGTSIAAVNRSVPLVKAIRNGELKFNKPTPMRKSFGGGSALARMQQTLSTIQEVAFNYYTGQ